MRKSNFITDTIIYFIGSVLVSILGFILSILYSKMFSPNDYGIYSLAFSMYSLITQSYSGWISISIVRNYEKFKNAKKDNVLFGTFFKLQIIMCIMLFTVVNILIRLLKVDSIMKNLFMIMTIMYLFEQELLLINTMLRVSGEVKQYNFNTVINSMLKIIFILGLYYIFNFKSIIVISVSLLLSDIVQVIYLTKKYKLINLLNKIYFDKSIIKDMFLFGFPLIGVAVTGWILNTSDRYIIRYFCSNVEVGLYSYAYSLGNSLFTILIQFIMLGAYPSIVQAWENKGRSKAEETIKDYLNIYFFVLLPIIFGIMGISKNFFLVCTDIRYQSEYIVFTITCMSIFFLGITQYYNKPWELKNNTKMVLFINVIVAIINIILNFLLIPIFGYRVAAITTLIANICYIFIAIMINHTEIKVKIDIIFFIKTLLASVIMLFFVLGIDFIDNFTILIKLILQIMIGIIIYFITVLGLKVVKIDDIKKILDKMKNKINK